MSLPIISIYPFLPLNFLNPLASQTPILLNLPTWILLTLLHSSPPIHLSVLCNLASAKSSTKTPRQSAPCHKWSFFPSCLTHFLSSICWSLLLSEVMSPFCLDNTGHFWIFSCLSSYSFSISFKGSSFTHVSSVMVFLGVLGTSLFLHLLSIPG